MAVVPPEGAAGRSSGVGETLLSPVSTALPQAVDGGRRGPRRALQLPVRPEVTGLVSTPFPLIRVLLDKAVALQLQQMKKVAVFEKAVDVHSDSNCHFLVALRKTRVAPTYRPC